MEIDHDLHIHTFLSSCCNDKRMFMENICKKELELGIKTICFTNHVWDKDVPCQDEFYITQDISNSKKNLPLPQVDGMRVLFGCETEYIGGNKLGMTKKHFDEYDFVIIPINHFNSFIRAGNIKTPLQAAELIMIRLEQLITLDIPFEKVGIPHLNTTLAFEDVQTEIIANMDETRMKNIFDFLAKKGTGIELNQSGFKQGWKKDEYAHLWYFRLAKKAGCKFYFCSDGHKISDIDKLQYLNEPAEMLKLSENDIYTIV